MYIKVQSPDHAQHCHFSVVTYVQLELNNTFLLLLDSWPLLSTCMEKLYLGLLFVLSCVVSFFIKGSPFSVSKPFLPFLDLVSVKYRSAEKIARTKTY